MINDLKCLAIYTARALANYPNHVELKAFFDKAEEVRAGLPDDVQKKNNMSEILLLTDKGKMSKLEEKIKAENEYQKYRVNYSE